MKKIAHQWIMATAILLSLPSLTAAQDTPALPQQSGDSIPRLTLAPDPRIDRGRVAAVQGTVGPDGLRFVVGELSILQPVVVMLLAPDEADDLTLSLFKKDWTNVRRTTSTRGSGMARFELRTQGGMNILLRGASAETPFALVVWVGDELRPAMPDVVLTYDEFRKRNPGAAGNWEPHRAGASPGRDGPRNGHTSVAVWIALAAVGGGAAASFARRALGRRKQA